MSRVPSATTLMADPAVLTVPTTTPAGSPDARDAASPQHGDADGNPAVVPSLISPAPMVYVDIVSPGEGAQGQPEIDSLVTAAPPVAPEAGAEGGVVDTSTGGSAGRSFAEEVALRRIATLHTMTRAEATTAVGTAGGGFQCRLSAKVEPLTLSLLHQVGGCAVLSCGDCLWSCRVALNCRADARRHCRCAHIVAGCHRGYRACGTTQA